MAIETIQNDEHCFCCGKKNEHGLKLEFSYPEPGRAKTSLSIPEYFTGWEKMTHGGLISMLLDETMAHACISRDVVGVTAEMTVRFKKPLEVGSVVTVEGTAEEARGRVVQTEAEILDDKQNVYAHARAKFLIQSG